MLNAQHATHTTHIANHHPPTTTVTGGASTNLNYINSNSCTTTQPSNQIVDNNNNTNTNNNNNNSVKKTYYNSIQDLTNFYYLNEESVEMCGGAGVCPSGDSVGISSADDLVDMIADYKYDLSNDLSNELVATPLNVAAATAHHHHHHNQHNNNNHHQHHHHQTPAHNNSVVNSNISRFEMCNSLTKANLLHNSGTATTGSKIKLKDDIFSHNQFNYHHVITQKLPNIEYFNYLESTNFGSTNGGNASGVVNSVGSIDLTRECAYIRNNDRLTSKIPTKITNFNF
jgi:hypothetical protein